jgi:putative flippase GtrA
MNKMKQLLSGYFTKAYLKYPFLAGFIGAYLGLKNVAVMIGPEVFIRPSLPFLYLAATVLPYPFIFLLPLVGMVGTGYPPSSFLGILVGTHFCFFISRIFKWRGEKQSRVTVMVASTFVSQLVGATVRHFTGHDYFFAYLPYGMIKSATAIPAIIIIGFIGLWLMEYLGVINFGRISESYGIKERLAPIISRFKK